MCINTSHDQPERSHCLIENWAFFCRMFWQGENAKKSLQQANAGADGLLAI